MVSSKVLRAFLDDALAVSKTQSLSLREQLVSYRSDAAESLAGGSIASTSANGRHIALTGHGAAALSQVDIVEAWQRLVDVYDQAVIDAGPFATDDDAATYMRTTPLREITGYTSNWMYIAK